MKTRQEQATVEYDECDGCGATDRVGATIDKQEFDPRSRSGGFQPMHLWPAHPWDNKKLCRRCRDNEVFLVDGIARGVPGMVRMYVFDVERCCDGKEVPCKRSRYCQGGWIYNEEGLRLPSAPPEPKLIDLKYVSAIVRQGDDAVWLWELSGGYWAPNPWFSSMNGQWMRDLAHGDRKVVVCEPTPATPWPTVLEPHLPLGEWAVDPHPERWGAELLERARHDLPEHTPPIYTCKLRVPMEILQ